MARGELAPTALQELLPRFMQARATAYTGKLTELTTRFFSELVQIGSAYSKELAGLLMPGITVPEVPLPAFDAADPVKWLQQLTDYAGQLNARAMKTYQSHLDRVAAGDATPQQVQQATADYFQHHLPEHLRRIGHLYFDLLNDLNAVRAEHEVEYLTGVLATANRAGKDPALALNLTGPLGASASGSIALANTKDERVLSAVQSPTCAAPTSRAGLRAEARHHSGCPGLDPGQEASVQVTVQLDQADDDPECAVRGGTSRDPPWGTSPRNTATNYSESARTRSRRTERLNHGRRLTVIRANGNGTAAARHSSPSRSSACAAAFPARTISNQYWQNLAQGVESIAVLSHEDMHAAGVPDHISRLPGYVNASPVLDAVDEFDAEFFGFSARDARSPIRSTGCSSKPRGRRWRTPATIPATFPGADRRLRRLRDEHLSVPALSQHRTRWDTSTACS